MTMEGIFSVVEIDGDIARMVEVYAVRDDKNGYPHFLICENGEWKYRSAKYYTNSMR